MLSYRCLSWVLGLVLVAVASGGMADADARDPAKSLRFPHASLAAYPGAIISLKDPGTGMRFYVESDGRRLIALDRDGEPAWGLDVLAEAKVAPAGRRGQAVVRHLRLHGDLVWAVCGKHDFVGIDVKTGEVKESRAR